MVVGTKLTGQRHDMICRLIGLIIRSGLWLLDAQVVGRLRLRWLRMVVVDALAVELRVEQRRVQPRVGQQDLSVVVRQVGHER